MEASKFLRIGGRGSDGKAKPLNTDEFGNVSSPNLAGYKILKPATEIIVEGGDFVDVPLNFTGADFDLYFRTATSGEWDASLIVGQSDEEITLDVERITEGSTGGVSGQSYIISKAEFRRDQIIGGAVLFADSKIRITSTSVSDHPLYDVIIVPKLFYPGEYDHLTQVIGEYKEIPHDFIREGAVAFGADTNTSGGNVRPLDCRSFPHVDLIFRNDTDENLKFSIRLTPFVRSESDTYGQGVLRNTILEYVVEPGEYRWVRSVEEPQLNRVNGLYIIKNPDGPDPTEGHYSIIFVGSKV